MYAELVFRRIRSVHARLTQILLFGKHLGDEA